MSWDDKTAKVLTDHNQWIQCIAFSPNGDYLVSGDDSRRIIVWDLREGSEHQYKNICEHTFPHHGGIWTIDFSHDARLIACAGDSGKIYIWDWVHKRLLIELAGHRDRVRDVVFSEDDRYLYSCGDDMSVIRWDITTGYPEELYRHNSWVMDMVLYGAYIVSADKDGNIYQYALDSGALYKKYNAHKRGIWSIDITWNQKIIVSAGEDGVVRLWNSHSLDPITDLREKLPYEGLNLSGVVGITDPQIRGLKELGAEYDY